MQIGISIYETLSKVNSEKEWHISHKVNQESHVIFYSESHKLGKEGHIKFHNHTLTHVYGTLTIELRPWNLIEIKKYGEKLKQTKYH